MPQLWPNCWWKDKRIKAKQNTDVKLRDEGGTWAILQCDCFLSDIRLHFFRFDSAHDEMCRFRNDSQFVYDDGKVTENTRESHTNTFVWHVILQFVPIRAHVAHENECDANEDEKMKWILRKFLWSLLLHAWDLTIWHRKQPTWVVFTNIPNQEFWTQRKAHKHTRRESKIFIAKNQWIAEQTNNDP